MSKWFSDCHRIIFAVVFFCVTYTLETMLDFLVPSEFDDFIDASLAVRMPNMEDLRVPSNALKLKNDTVNFRNNFIFVNSIKRHICDIKNLQLGHDLPSSVNDRMILLFHEGLFS